MSRFICLCLSEGPPPDTTLTVNSANISNHLPRSSNQRKCAKTVLISQQSVLKVWKIIRLIPTYFSCDCIICICFDCLLAILIMCGAVPMYIKTPGFLPYWHRTWQPLDSLHSPLTVQHTSDYCESLKSCEVTPCHGEILTVT